VDWQGAFPVVSVVQTEDTLMENYYNTTYGPGTASDSSFLVASTPNEAVYDPAGTDQYDIYLLPEPGTMVLLGSSLALLSGLVLRRRRAA
jgi:hypothetical protein